MAGPKNAPKSDVLLTVDGAFVGYNAAIDPETSNKRIFPGLAPKLAPQVRQDSVSYNYLPPDIDIVAAFEEWRGGSGFLEVAPTDVAPVQYNYSQGIDLAYAQRAYLAPERQSALASTGGEVAGAPTKFWDGSDGVFMIAGAYIYKWDVSTAAWVLKDDASGDAVAYTDIMEMDGVLFAARGPTVDYKYSSDGETWTAFTGSDDNFSFFAVRGIAAAEAVMWGVKLTGILKNSTNAVNAGVAWSAGDAIAHTSENVQSMVEANDDLYVFTNQGIYRYSGTAQESVWTGGRKMYRATNGVGAFLWEDGGIYVPYGDRLLRYDPLGDNTQTPSLQFMFPTEEMRGNTELNGTITAIGGDADWLYVALKNYAGNTYIMRGKPATGTWHTYLYLGANNCNAIQAFGSVRYHATNPVMAFGYGTGARHVVLPRAGLRPEDDVEYLFDTNGGTVYGPWVSIGARQFPKMLTQGRLITENCTAGMPVTLSYELDGMPGATTFVSAVSSGVTSAVVNTELTFMRIRYVITMATAANTMSPRLLGALLHTNLLVPRKRMWAMDLDLSSVVESHGKKWTKTQQEAFLFSTIGKRVTLSLFDEHTYAVLLQSIEAQQGIKVTPEGPQIIYNVVFTEIAETTESQSALIWDQDQWDRGKVWG